MTWGAQRSRYTGEFTLVDVGDIDELVQMPTFTLGTDCTGIDAAYHAVLRCLPVDTTLEYKFASDVCGKIRGYLEAVCKPQIVYDDVTTRDVDLVPSVDLYIAGFPCQSFSTIGLQRGFDDDRGSVVFHLIKYLHSHPPRAFVLENVTGLLHHRHGETFKYIMELLTEKLPGFHIQHHVFSPTDIGFPHQRRRLFIIGTRNELPMVEATDFLARREEQQLESLLLSRQEATMCDHTACRVPPPKGMEQLARVGAQLAELTKSDMPIVNIGLSNTYWQTVYNHTSPCLTRYTYTYYIVNQKRFFTPIDALRVQGFADETVAAHLDLFNPNNKNKTLARLWAGNSICIPLLASIIDPLVDAIISLQ